MSSLDPSTPMFAVSRNRLAIVVCIELEESRPRVTTTARTPAELARLEDWVAGQPSLLALLRLGYALENGSTLTLHLPTDGTLECGDQA